MAVAKADPAVGKADLAGVVRRAGRVVVGKARGMGVVGRVGMGIRLGVVVVMRLPNNYSQSRRRISSCRELRHKDVRVVFRAEPSKATICLRLRIHHSQRH